MTGVPFLIAAPTSAPVSLLQVKEHLRVTDDAQDVAIGAFVAAAVGHLDGYTGVLGRAIMPQTWGQEWDDGSTVLRLALPDASAVVVKADGVTISTGYEVKRTHSGAVVVLDGVTADVVRVEYTCGMGAGLLETARMIVLLMVEGMFERDDSGQGAIDALTGALRWRSV